MAQTFKAKIAHVLENGDKLELEAWVEAENHEGAYEAAKTRLKEAVTLLSAAPSISADKSKIEMGVQPH